MEEFQDGGSSGTEFERELAGVGSAYGTALRLTGTSADARPGTGRRPCWRTAISRLYQG